MSDDPEMMWALLVVKGPDVLGPDEQAELARWIAGQTDLAPADADECANLHALAAALVGRGLAEPALAPARLAAAWAEQGGDEALMLNCTFTLINALTELGLAGDAEAVEEGLGLAGRYCEMVGARWGANDPQMVPALIMHSRATLAKGRVGEAGSLARRGFEIAEATLDVRNPWHVVAEQTTAERAADLIREGLDLLDGGDAAGAVVPLRRALGWAESIVATHAVASYWLAVALMRLGDAEAELHFRMAIPLHMACLGDHHEGTYACRQALAGYLWSVKRWDEAETEFAAAAADAAAHDPDGEAAQSTRDNLATFRRERLLAEADGKLYGWALSGLRAVHGDGRFTLAVAALQKVAGLLEDDRMAAEAGTLLAAAGRIEDAVAAAPPADPESGWPGARVHAEAIATLLAGGRRAEAEAALRRALALATGESPLYDLVAALDSEACVLAAPLLPPEGRAMLAERVIEERVDIGDLDGALALYDQTEEPADPSVVLDLACLAAHRRRADAVRRLAEELPDTMGEWRVYALLDSGAEDDGLAMIASLEPGRQRADALAMAAAHFGAKGDGAAFGNHAAAALVELAAHAVSDPLPAMRRIAEGSLALTDRHGTLDWAGGCVPTGLMPDFVEGLVSALQNQKRLDDAFLAAETLEGERRERVLAGLRSVNSHDSAQARDHSRSLIQKGEWDSAVSALTMVANPFSFVDGCIEVASAAAAAGDHPAAAVALRAAFHRLPGPLAQGVIVDPRLRLSHGRKLGKAVALSLGADERAAFADAALSQAAGMDDVAAATPFVVAAGWASLPVQRP
jgi:tetratricopeptide (TPR) repeat protein